MAAELFDPVSGLYCERLDASFWAEPANAVTNAAFIVAAVVTLARRRGDASVTLLAALVFTIGIGSFLFHTFATGGAMIADVAPIQLFIAVYFFLALRRFLGIGALVAALSTIAFVALAALAPRLAPPGAWQGLAGYAGGLAGLLGVGAAVLMRGDPASRRTGRTLLGVAALFALSLGFRTLDRAACAIVSTGTHPLWHLTNALVLYLLMQAFAERARPQAKVEGRGAGRGGFSPP